MIRDSGFSLLFCRRKHKR